ncbi:Uncharacterized protein PFLU_4226 [Pseudomonas [fluorescens] SBW25]|uniref:Uncharacterized protein n=1 Tax=Pseudomonas fluorescens (strain SBW25) TaxID=216595 RepID=C3JZW8_PSEFS|nr:Uncharacterized protein PFLU_4226 [Pseudomonas fluorescens SBW25]
MGLLHEQLPLRMQRVNAQHTLLHILQTIRRIHLTRRNLQADARTRHQVTINPLLGRVQLRIRPTKPLAIPQMNPRLVFHFNIHAQVLEQHLGRTDHRILSLVGQVRIEVENVVVLDALVSRQVRLMIPHRLEQAARREKALVHAKVGQARGNLGIDGVGHGQVEQSVDGQCHAHSFLNYPQLPLWRGSLLPLGREAALIGVRVLPDNPRQPVLGLLRSPPGASALATRRTDR